MEEITKEFNIDKNKGNEFFYEQTKIDEDLILTIEFAEDPDTGKLYIKDAKSSNENYLRRNTETPITTDTKLSIDILNSLQGKNEYKIKDKKKIGYLYT